VKTYDTKAAFKMSEIAEIKFNDVNITKEGIVDKIV